MMAVFAAKREKSDLLTFQCRKWRPFIPWPLSINGTGYNDKPVKWLLKRLYTMLSLWVTHYVTVCNAHIRPVSFRIHAPVEPNEQEKQTNNNCLSLYSVPLILKGQQLIETVTLLEERGIELRSLKENIDTTTSTGKLMFHIIGAMAEFERDVISERTQAGLDAARARGRQGGRPKAIQKIEPRNLARAKELYAARQNTIAEIMHMTGFKSRNTFYKYVVNGDMVNA